MLPKIEKMVIEHPVLVLCVSLLVTIFFAYYIPRIGFSSSSEKFLIQGDPDRLYFEKSKKLFGNDQVLVIAIVAPEGQTIYTKERLERLELLTNEIEKVNGVDGVVSLSNVPAIRAPVDPVTGIIKKEIEVKPLLKKIPETEDEWKNLRREIDRIPLYKGNLVSEDDRAVAVLAFVQEFEDSSREDELMRSIKLIIERDKGEESIYVAGVPETSVEMTKRMIKDLKVLLPITFLLIVVVLLVFFRHARGVILPLITVTVTTVWTVSFMQIVDISVTMVTMILPPLMLAIGSSYSIHLMSEYMAEVKPEASVRDIVKHCINKIAFPIVICGFTTMIGFGSLILNKIPTIRELGIAAVAGVFFAVMIALFVVPASLMLMKKPKRMARKTSGAVALNRILDRIARFNLRNGKAIFYAAVALVLGSLFGIYRINIDTDFLSFFPENDPVRQAVNHQTKHLAGAAPFNIVLETDRPNVFKHPAMLKRLEALQRWAEREVEGVDTTVSIVDYVKILNQAFHRNDPAYYKIPDSIQEVSQILFMYSTSGSPSDLAPFFTPDYTTVNIIIRSRLVGSSKTNKAIRLIEKKAEELFKKPEYERPGPKKVMSAGLVHEKEEVEEDEEEDIFWEDEDEADVDAPGPSGEADEEEIDIFWDDDTPDTGEPGTEDISEGEKAEGSIATEPEEKPADDTPQAEVLEEESALVAGLELPVPSKEEFPWPKVDVHMTGTIYLMNKSAVAVSKSQVIGLGTVLVAIFLIMSLLFLSPKIGFLAMLPNIFPIFMLFGIMGYSGITLNFSTSLIAAIALGIGVDDTIQYINRYNTEVQATKDQSSAMTNALLSMGKPMIYTSVALFFGFIILTFSNFVPIRQFGLLTAVTIIIALISDLFILPTLMVNIRVVTLWDLIGLEVGDDPSHYIKIFNGLTNHQARVAVLMGHVEEFRDGQLIIREDEIGREMFVILKGDVNIFKGKGEKELSLFNIGPGDAFGEMAILRKSVRSASVRARGRVVLLVIDEQTLDRLRKRYPRISSVIFYNLTQLLSDRLQTTTEQLVESVDKECLIDE